MSPEVSIMKTNLLFLLLLAFSFLPAQSYKVTNEILVVKPNGATYDTLRNAWAGGMQAPQFGWVDLNKDCKKDLVVYDRADRKFMTFLNISKPGESKFLYAPRYESIFDTCKCAGWALLVDYNCDGNEDVMCGTTQSYVYAYENYTIGTDSMGFRQKIPGEMWSKYSFGTSYLWSSLADIPTIHDVDGDGDLDFFTFGNMMSYVEWHQNMAMEKTGRCDTLMFENSSYCWGHFIESDVSNQIFLYDTINCPLNNLVTQPNPNSTRHAGSTLLMLDLNNNGLKDLLVGDISFNSINGLFNDAGTPTYGFVDSVQYHFPNYDVPADIDFFPSMFYGDHNNDGVKDLVVSTNLRDAAENHHHVLTYKNTGTDNDPYFQYTGRGFVVDEEIEVGSYATPTFFDYNGDGKLDILVGNLGFYDRSDSLYHNGWTVLENIGTTQEPAFSVVDDYLNWKAFNPYPTLKKSVPALADLDKDGDKDLVVGHLLGTLYYFRNDDNGNGIPVFKFVTDALSGIDVGDDSAPTFWDADNDGDMDLFIGNAKGYITYAKNNSIGASIVFDTLTTRYGDIKIADLVGSPLFSKGYAKPMFADVNQDGNMDLLVGNVYGKLQVFTNLPTGATGTATNLGFLTGYDFGSYAAPAAAVIDGTNMLTYLVGTEKGGLQLFKVPTVAELDTFHCAGVSISPPQQGNELGLKIYPNPAAGSVTIELKNASTAYHQIEIWDMMGRRIVQTGTAASSLTLDLSPLATGVYVVKVSDNAGEVSAKLSVQR